MTVSTTWVSPASGTIDLSNGAIVSEANWDALASDLYNLGGTTGHIGARAYNSAALSIPNATDTVLTFNGERYDTDPNGEIHSTASNTSRLTCRTAGKYLVAASVAFAANATGSRFLRLLVNGSIYIAIVSSHGNSAALDTLLIAAAFYDLAAGDYVEADVHQTSGGALNVNSAAGHAYTPEIAMGKV